MLKRKTALGVGSGQETWHKEEKKEEHGTILMIRESFGKAATDEEI